MATRLTEADIGYLSDEYNRLRDEGWSATEAAEQVDGILVSLIGTRSEGTEGGHNGRQHIAKHPA